MRRLVYLFPLFMFIFLFTILYLSNIYLIHHSRPLFGAIIGASMGAFASILNIPNLLSMVKWREEGKKKKKEWY